MLKERVAIITGGAKGIGYGIARKFAEHGCHIVLNVHRDIETYEGGPEKVKGLEGLGVRCRVVKADVSDSAQAAGLVEETVKEFGKVDILVNNAAHAPHPISIIDLPEEQWDSVLSVNLKGAYLLCKFVGPHMKKAGYGKIVNISAVSGTSPLISNAHYNSSKAALNMLTKDVALEFAPYGINVNCISPGIIVTELLETVIPEGIDKQAFFDRFARHNVPMQRVGYPDDIANAALFLASEMSSYITGEVLLVAGGVPLFRSAMPAE
jgi:NAD(P)-dependent dehydrogenase (short-subunit alcohol dehydrogenase family)